MKIFQWVFVIASLSLLAGCASMSSSGPDAGGAGSLASDLDGDSIPNDLDECTDTAPRTLVDASGCELKLGVVEGLDFRPGQTALSDDSKAVLDVYIEALSRYPEVVVSLAAHTDNRGPALGNRELSKERVLAVVGYMVANGIDPARMRPIGYGESRPVAANATAEGREKNRRIEIEVLEGLL